MYIRVYDHYHMIYAYINHQLFSCTILHTSSAGQGASPVRGASPIRGAPVTGNPRHSEALLESYGYMWGIFSLNIIGMGIFMGRSGISCSTANRHRELSPFRARSVGGLEVSKGEQLLEQISGSPKAKAKSDWASSGLCIPQITQKQTKRCNFIFCCRTYPG